MRSAPRRPPPRARRPRPRPGSATPTPARREPFDPSAHASSSIAHARVPSSAASTSRSSTWRSGSNPASLRWSTSSSAERRRRHEPHDLGVRHGHAVADGEPRTSSNASRSPVTSWSTRFIDTVTMPPRSGTANPIARTAGSPPLDSRNADAIAFAAASSVAVQVDVERDQRLPGADRGRAGRPDRVRTEVRQPLAAARPPPAAPRTRRGGRRRATPARARAPRGRRGRRAGRASRRARVRTRERARRIASIVDAAHRHERDHVGGAHPRVPALRAARMSIRSTAAAAPAMRARPDGVGIAEHRGVEPVVVGVGLRVDDASARHVQRLARSPRSRRVRRPSLKFGTTPKSARRSSPQHRRGGPPARPWVDRGVTRAALLVRVEQRQHLDRGGRGAALDRDLDLLAVGRRRRRRGSRARSCPGAG